MEENFKCVRCGTCCRWPGYVRLSDAEVDAVADFLGMAVTDFIEKWTRLTGDRTGLSLVENADGSCPFLLETPEGSACQIQPVKPRQCQDFPYKWNFPGWEKECRGARSESK